LIAETSCGRCFQIESLGAQSTFSLVNDPFFQKIDEDEKRGALRALAAPGLQEIQLTFLDRKFDILHVFQFSFQECGTRS